MIYRTASLSLTFEDHWKPLQGQYFDKNNTCHLQARQRKGPESPKLAEWKPITRVTNYLEVKRSKVKVTGPINALTDAPYWGLGYNFLKISLLVPATNFYLGKRMQH